MADDDWAKAVDKQEANKDPADLSDKVIILHLCVEFLTARQHVWVSTFGFA